MNDSLNMSWRSDLNWVLNDAKKYEMINDHSSCMDAVNNKNAIMEAAGLCEKMLRKARRIAVVGIKNITVESCQQITGLMQYFDGDLFVDENNNTITSGKIAINGTLQAVKNAEVVIDCVPGETGYGINEIRKFAKRMVTIESIDKLLETEYLLDATNEGKSVAVVVSGCINNNVLERLHRKLLGVRTEVEGCVFVLPREDDASIEGAKQVLRWRTNLNFDGGGIGFRGGEAVGAGAYDASDYDLVVKFAGRDEPLCEDVVSKMILFSNRREAGVMLQVGLPCLQLGTRSHVMRCDGQVLKMYGDFDEAIDEPLERFLKKVLALGKGGDDE